MMKFLFSLLFMMLNFKLNFWLIQMMMITVFLMFIFNYSFTFLCSLSNLLGLDLISYILVSLSFWLGFSMIMASEKIYVSIDYEKIFIFLVLILIMFLFLTFVSSNLFLFYLSFEASLIPILFIIVESGYKAERIQAGVYMFFYTLSASLPMLMFIFTFYWGSFSLDNVFLNENFNSLILYFMLNMVFFVELIMFLIHLWLPKAHVEAPIAGSMILAGVMFKLGGYESIRFLVIFQELSMKVNFFIEFIFISGDFNFFYLLTTKWYEVFNCLSFCCSYSFHNSGILTILNWGLMGALLVMIAHGLCSSGLFVLVNICYERLISRSLYIVKGLINIFPFLSLWWFLLLSSNMLAAPSLNWLGEFMMINSLLWY